MMKSLILITMLVISGFAIGCTNDGPESDPVYCNVPCTDGSGNLCEVDCDTWQSPAQGQPSK